MDKRKHAIHNDACYVNNADVCLLCSAKPLHKAYFNLRKE